MKRRQFIKTAALTGGSVLATSGISSHAEQATVTVQNNADAAPKSFDGFVLALGGGAAKAFAHIHILEAMDELGIQPKALSGTSMGAILGGFYLSGMSGREIREYTAALFTQKADLFQKLFLNDGRTWGSLLNITRPAIIDPLVLFETVFPAGLAKTFEELEIPFHVVTSDFYSQSETIVSSGELLPAIAASSALPMLLTPVKINGRVLIDGGFTNPTPFDVFGDTPYATVGIDVTGSTYEGDSDLPSGMETWIGSFSITLHSLVAAKLGCNQPDLLIEPPIGKFSTMDFFKVEEILQAAEPAKEVFKREMDQLLNSREL